MANCDRFYFIAWGLVGGGLCLFGLCGNFLSFLAFQKDKRSSTTSLLQALAVSDFLLLTSVFITDSVPYICNYVEGCVNPWASWPYIRYIWIMTPIAHMCSIWLVFLIALNRYWAVCKAMDMVHVWNNRRTPMYILTVVLLVITFNMPRFFEYQIVSVPYNDAVTNATEYRLTEIRTDFGKRPSYKVAYKVILVNMFLIIIPIALLVFFTIIIITVLRKTHRRVNRQSAATTSIVGMATSPSGNSPDNGTTGIVTSLLRKRPKRQKDITSILIIVLVVAIICQTPLSVFHFFRYTSDHPCGHVVFYLDNISKLLVNVNSSVNFLIYCVFSPKFRNLLLISIKCVIIKQVSTALNDYTTTWGGPVRTPTCGSQMPKAKSSKTRHKAVLAMDKVSRNSSFNGSVAQNESNGGITFNTNKQNGGTPSSSSHSNGHVCFENGSYPVKLNRDQSTPETNVNGTEIKANEQHDVSAENVTENTENVTENLHAENVTENLHAEKTLNIQSVSCAVTGNVTASYDGLNKDCDCQMNCKTCRCEKAPAKNSNLECYEKHRNLNDSVQTELCNNQVAQKCLCSKLKQNHNIMQDAHLNKQKQDSYESARSLSEEDAHNYANKHTVVAQLHNENPLLNSKHMPLQNAFKTCYQDTDIVTSSNNAYHVENGSLCDISPGNKQEFEGGITVPETPDSPILPKDFQIIFPLRETIC